MLLRLLIMTSLFSVMLSMIYQQTDRTVSAQEAEKFREVVPKLILASTSNAGEIDSVIDEWIVATESEEFREYRYQFWQRDIQPSWWELFDRAFMRRLADTTENSQFILPVLNDFPLELRQRPAIICFCRTADKLIEVEGLREYLILKSRLVVRNPSDFVLLFDAVERDTSPVAWLSLCADFLATVPLTEVDLAAYHELVEFMLAKCKMYSGQQDLLLVNQLEALWRVILSQTIEGEHHIDLAYTELTISNYGMYSPFNRLRQLLSSNEMFPLPDNAFFRDLAKPATTISARIVANGLLFSEFNDSLSDAQYRLLDQTYVLGERLLKKGRNEDALKCFRFVNRSSLNLLAKFPMSTYAEVLKFWAFAASSANHVRILGSDAPRVNLVNRAAVEVWNLDKNQDDVWRRTWRGELDHFAEVARLQQLRED